jgi:hypothetical protein
MISADTSLLNNHRGPAISRARVGGFCYFRLGVEITAEEPALPGAERAEPT